MFFLILVNVILSAEFSCKNEAKATCKDHPQCAWTSKGCVIQKKACQTQSQDACLNSVDCSWDTCVQQCRPFDMVEHECATNDNFCQIKIDGKSMTKEMCAVTEGCAWDMCFSNCNQKFLIPTKCQESACAKLDEGPCLAEDGCGWDKCASQCNLETKITDECITRLGVGVVPTVPMTPGMRPVTPMRPMTPMPGMAGYAAAGRMPTIKFDPSTGRQYQPYHRRPLILDRRVWTWLAALPFVCIILFCLGYNFPSGLCDSNESGGDILQEGEDMAHRGRSHSNFRSGAHISLMHPTSDYTTSTIHTMSTKPPSQIRVPYRGPSKSNLFQQTMNRGREDDSIERERAFDPKREPRMPEIPESDVDTQEYMPNIRR